MLAIPNTECWCQDLLFCDNVMWWNDQDMANRVLSQYKHSLFRYGDLHYKDKTVMTHPNLALMGKLVNIFTVIGLKQKEILLKQTHILVTYNNEINVDKSFTLILLSTSFPFLRPAVTQSHFSSFMEMLSDYGFWAMNYFSILFQSWWQEHFNCLLRERHNSGALAMELRLSCTNPSILL